ncbi:hypothetical protein K457DRAFT_129501 [Linnemannia elongata AG-77]|uniref:Uncharacterized protein n=1 Tax=Linnemannia elongata AG-77 TaxID=1314771 RepID=A0A197JII4_9FUNG|nr:hypothetical protein K457DRAFT_129501 [Linnemannia elongata AG-77]
MVDRKSISTSVPCLYKEESSELLPPTFGAFFFQGRLGVAIALSEAQVAANRILAVLAYHLYGGKISFAGKDRPNFVDKALHRLRPHTDGVHSVMDEPMVVEAVEEYLNATGEDPTFLDYLDQIFQIRYAFEPLVTRSLQRFNGYRLVDIPFLQGVTLPTCYDKLDLQIDETNTANGFGYSTIDVRADLTFLSEFSSNKMLIANDGKHPDGAWFSLKTVTLALLRSTSTTIV